MKVSTLMDELKRLIEDNPEINNYTIFTEQCDLYGPEHKLSYKEYIKSIEEATDLYTDSEEYIKQLKESKNKINNSKKAGWRYIIDSEGTVYRDTGAIKYFDNLNGKEHELPNMFIDNNEKAVVICTNY